MEEIKAPKKERKFLKAMGNIGKVLVEELVMGIARKFIGKTIDKVGNKKQGLVIAFIVLASSFAFAQFPTNTNKQRLGFQTTADGLVWRGSISDTASIQPVSNQNAWLIIDTVNLKIYSFDFTSNVWGLVGGGGGLTMPFDSITFNTAKDGTVGVGEVEYNDTQGSLIQGLKGGNVTNVIGQQLHQRVNNRTGLTLAKGTAVYLSGSQGNRITVAKALGVTDAFSANTFGIVAESIANNQSGYVITEGLITGINTSSLVEDSAVYLSPTVAGGLTSTKPQAPQHTVYIGVCVKSNAGSGELFVKIRNGQELDELHDVRITSPVTNASLYYSGGLWRDTTPTLLVSDTAAMLANYATKAYADTSGRFYARQDFEKVTTSTLTWTQSDTLVVGGTGVVQVYRNGQILLPTQYTIPTNASVVIGATAYKVGENYTVIFPRGGGAGSGGGSGSLTSISGGTGIIVNPNPITTTGTVSADLSVLMELTDTSLLNLTTRFASKLNPSDTISLSNRINAKGTGTVTSVSSGFGLLGGTITTTGTLRLDTTTIYARLQDSINVAIGNDTIKILKQEYQPALSSVLTWTITPKFPIQLKAYILVFRNGQLLNNDQYNLTDTNKITIVSTSFKTGANYTVATVSGIGSINTGIFPNPVYPEAGIALSTGSTWASSIPNNSSNWNTAFTDRLKWDGGSTDLVASTGRTSLGGTTIGQSMFTLTNPSAITFPRFNADNSVSALTAANFRSAIGAGTVTTVNASTTSGNPISIDNNTTTPTIELLSATSARNGYLTSTDWTTFNGKQAALSNASASVSGILTSTDWTTFNNKQNAITLTTTGTSGLATFNGTTLNIPNYTASGGSGTVTSVGLTAPSIFNVGGSPVTTSGTLALTYSGTALPLLNGGTGATTADAALTNLGATAQGKLLFGLTNTVTDKFIKVNTDNTITLLNAADTRTAIGATVRGANTFLLADLGAISFLRYNADNTVSQRAADGMRSDLGGTTIGQSMFTLTNPSAITFPRFNANNTVSALSAADFRTAIGAGTGNGNGTVTSVTGSLPISSSGGTTPNITIANAGVSTTGVVTASTQTFGGAKTFAGDINGSSALNVTGFSTLTGGASVGTMTTTSSLTHIIGVNSNNAIGEIALGSGLNLSSGTLNIGGFVLATLDFPNTSAQSSSDITVSYTGAAVSHPVMLAIPDGSAPANTNYTAWVSSANTVKIRFNNYSSGSINPASGQFTVFVLNL
jgi:hypothetical protein